MRYSKMQPQLQELVRTMICIHMQENDAVISASDVQNIVAAVSVLEDTDADVGKAAQAEPTSVKEELDLPEDLPEEVKALIRSLAGNGNVEVITHRVEVREEKSETSEADEVITKLQQMHKDGIDPKEAIKMLSEANVHPIKLLGSLLGSLKKDLLEGHQPHYELDRTCDGSLGKVEVYRCKLNPQRFQIVHRGKAYKLEMVEGRDFDIPYMRCVELCAGSTKEPHCLIK